MDDEVSHVDLLRLARSLHSVSLGTDIDAVHTELCALRNALVRHIRAEEGQFDSFSSPAVAAVRRGHEDLLREIDAILTHADGSDYGCRCVLKASHLTKAIARQAALENALHLAIERRH